METFSSSSRRVSNQERPGAFCFGFDLPPKGELSSLLTVREKCNEGVPRHYEADKSQTHHGFEALLTESV